MHKFCGILLYGWPLLRKHPFGDVFLWYNQRMKKLLLLMLIVVAAALFFWSSPAEDNDPEDTSGTTVVGEFQPDPSTATFTFDEEVVTLSAGRSEAVDDVGLVTETELLSESATGDLNADGKPDKVVLLARSGGGSGTFIYAAAYVSGPVSYKGTNALFIGDRIAPQSISVTNGVATVRYLDRKPDEAFSAEPSVSTTKQFFYRNGELQER